MQTCLGFLLTTISIELIPYFVKAVGWRYAFAILAPGPLLGVIAMLRLRALPEAVKIAHGTKIDLARQRSAVRASVISDQRSEQ